LAFYFAELPQGFGTPLDLFHMQFINL